MSYNYQESKEKVKALLGEHYSLVSSEMDTIVREAISQSSSLTSANQESARRRVEINEINKQNTLILEDKESSHSKAMDELNKSHKKSVDELTKVHSEALSGFSDYDTNKTEMESLSTKLTEQEKKLTEKDSQLEGFYSQVKTETKDLAGKIDFENEMFKSKKEMFSYAENIDEMDNDQVAKVFKQLKRDFQMLGVGAEKTIPHVITPSLGDLGKNKKKNPYFNIPKAGGVK